MSRVLTPTMAADLWVYDPDTGKFAWATVAPTWMNPKSSTWHMKRAGKPAFTLLSNGYAIAMVGKVKIYAHRAAWCLTNGSWPEGPVDHINRDKLDNRIINLRQCTIAENVRNAAHGTGGSSAYHGVSKCKQTGKYNAAITVDRRRIWLGRHDNEINAARAYDEAARIYHGDFASLNFVNAQHSQAVDVLAH